MFPKKQKIWRRRASSFLLAWLLAAECSIRLHCQQDMTESGLFDAYRPQFDVEDGEQHLAVLCSTCTSSHMCSVALLEPCSVNRRGPKNCMLWLCCQFLKA